MHTEVAVKEGSSLHGDLKEVALVLVLVLAKVHGAESQEPEAALGPVAAEGRGATLDLGVGLLRDLGECFSRQGSLLGHLLLGIRVRCVGSERQEAGGKAPRRRERLGVCADLADLIRGGGGRRHFVCGWYV